MTPKAKGTDILKPALTSAFNHRHDMVCCPGANVRFKPRKFLSKHIERDITIRIMFNQPRKMRRLKPRLPQQAPKDSFDLITINAADSAYTSISFKYLLAKISRIASKLVFVDARV